MTKYTIGVDFGTESGRVLLVDVAGNEKLERSSRNLEGVELQSNFRVHPYHLLKYEKVLISRPAAEKLQEALQPSGPRAASGSRAASL